VTIIPLQAATIDVTTGGVLLGRVPQGGIWKQKKISGNTPPVLRSTVAVVEVSSNGQ
jgi:hypothetical protein